MSVCALFLLSNAQNGRCHLLLYASSSPPALPPSRSPSLLCKPNALAASVNLDIRVVERRLAQDEAPASHDLQGAERHVHFRDTEFLEEGREGGREGVREGISKRYGDSSEPPCGILPLG